MSTIQTYLLSVQEYCFGMELALVTIVQSEGFRIMDQHGYLYKAKKGRQLLNMM